MNYLLLYSSTNGQTKKIMSRIAGILSQQGMTCDIYDVSTEMQIELSKYHKVMIGASIRYGRFRKEMLRFIENHHNQLNRIPSAFFCVNLTARKAEKCTPETNGYMRTFLEHSIWSPTISAVFAGALRYPVYRWFDRIMIQWIMKMTKGETDTTKEVEYTDWNAVDIFAKKFAQLSILSIVNN